MHSHKKVWMREAPSENARFLWLMLSVFCLMLGGASLLLAAVEYFFFELNFGKPIVLGATLVLLAGGGMLRLALHHQLR